MKLVDFRVSCLVVCGTLWYSFPNPPKLWGITVSIHSFSRVLCILKASSSLECIPCQCTQCFDSSYPPKHPFPVRHKRDSHQRDSWQCSQAWPCSTWCTAYPNIKFLTFNRVSDTTTSTLMTAIRKGIVLIRETLSQVCFILTSTKFRMLILSRCETLPFGNETPYWLHP